MNYAKIKPVDVANGEGVRASVFFSGCPHHCKGCFNAELWNYDAGEAFTFETINKIITATSYDYITGLSLLGGEPLDPKNIQRVTELCNIFKRYHPNKTIWCYTGYLFEDLLRNPLQRELLEYIDVLVDGRFIEALKDEELRFRGSSNQRIINVPLSLEKGETVVMDI